MQRARSQAPLGARARGDGHKLEHCKFCLNIREDFRAVPVLQCWQRLPGEAAESLPWRPSEGAGHGTGHPAWGGPAGAGAGPGASGALCKPQPFCDCVIV